MTVLETERCLIRQIQPEDYEEMFALYSDLELMRYVGDSTAITPEDCRRWLDITLNNYRIKGYGLFLVEEFSSGTCIGFIGLTHPGGIPDPEIKYTLKKHFWGTGLATELVSGLTKHAFASGWASRVVATIDPENQASLRVMEKAGFSRLQDIIEDDGSITAYYACEAA